MTFYCAVGGIVLHLHGMNVFEVSVDKMLLQTTAAGNDLSGKKEKETDVQLYDSNAVI